MPRDRTLLCVHPHPDDETIACGGVLARAAATGGHTVVVTCTGGEAGENLAGIDLQGHDLAWHRRRELAAALAALGVGHHHWLGYRDSGMAGTATTTRPDSFHQADLAAAAARLAAIIRSERPDVVVSDDASGTYGHPDHVKAHRVTVRAVEMAADEQAPIGGEPWTVAKRYVHTMGHARLLRIHRALLTAGLVSPFGEREVDSADELGFGSPDASVSTHVDVRDHLADKRAALQAHRSQIAEDSFFLNIPEPLLEDVFGVEQFILEAADGSAVRPGAADVSQSTEQDLFEGLDDAMAGTDPT